MNAEAVATLVMFSISMGVPLVTLVGAYLIGSWQEKRHFERLEADEFELSGIMITDLKRFPDNWDVRASQLVAAEVVIANDKFKTWVAGWINLFGGRVMTYETLIERARREAIVRMRREAQQCGCNVVWNIRIETATIQAGKTAGVEALAYGTAIRVVN